MLKMVNQSAELRNVPNATHHDWLFWGIPANSSTVFRSRKHEYYPEHLCRSKWSLPGFGSGSGSVEQRLAESHAARERDFRSQRAVEQDDEAWKVGLQRAYLDFCRKLPFYG